MASLPNGLPFALTLGLAIVLWGGGAGPEAARAGERSQPPENSTRRAAGASDGPLLLQELRFEGLVNLTEPAVRHHLGLTSGTPLAPETVDQALRRLWNSGLIDDVVLTLEPTGAEQAILVVAIVERPLISSLRFEGLDRLTRARLRRWLAEQDLLPDPGRPVDRAALERLRGRITGFLASQGRSIATTYLLVETAAGTVEALFALEPPPLGEVLDSIVFEGAQALPETALRRVMRRNKEASRGASLGRRGRLDRPGLADDLEALRQLHRDRGYKDVEIGEARVEPAGGTGKRALRVRLVVPVREGARWTLGGLSVAGNRAASDQSLLDLFPPERDVLNLSAVERWVAAIREHYAAQGRIDTAVEHELRERPGGKVDVVARIVEAPPVTLGRLTVVGNTRTSASVLRQEIGVDEGQALDLPTIQRSLTRIQSNGLFQLEDPPISVVGRDAETGKVDLLLSGREADPFRIDFGGGWSRADGLSGHLALSARNLFGTGSSAGLRFIEGDIRDQLELFYTYPRLFGRDQSASAEIFDRGDRFSLFGGQVFQRQARGSRLAWSRPLGHGQSVQLSLEHSRLDDLQQGADTAATRALSSRRSSLIGDWLFDSRDDPLAPSRGMRARFGLTASGRFLGGDQDLLEPRADFAWFRPLPRENVFALRLAGGLIETRGDVPPSPLDAYFLGGPRSVRGFATGTLVARQQTGEPLTDDAGFVRGGNRFLETSLELRFPIRGPFSGALFVDCGQVWADGQTVDLDSLRASVGVELWLRLPRLGLPMRLVWAHNLDPLPGDEFDSLLVGFGARF